LALIDIPNLLQAVD